MATEMDRINTDGQSDGWTAEDFLDAVQNFRPEDDPWSVATAPEEIPSGPEAQGFRDPHETAGSVHAGPNLRNPDAGLNSVTRPADVRSVRKPPGSGEDRSRPPDHSQLLDIDADLFTDNPEMDFDQVEQSIISDAAQFELDDQDHEDDPELGFDQMEQSIISEAAQFDQDAEDDVDEPEPVAEFDDELRDPLYELQDLPQSIFRDLDVDQFLSGISFASDEERLQISAILGEHGPRSLSRTLAWLREKQWTGGSLLRYLTFRELWFDTAHWWESGHWSHQSQCWWHYSTPYHLTREGCYYLIHSRAEFEIDEIIGEDWLDDWNRMALWKRGFTTFASFAVFRAGMSEEEDWISGLDSDQFWDAAEFDVFDPYAVFRGNSMEPSMRRNTGMETNGPPVRADELLHQGAATWFWSQNWYDPSEWHDGLDWAWGRVESSHPYLRPESPSGPKDAVEIQVVK